MPSQIWKAWRCPGSQPQQYIKSEPTSYRPQASRRGFRKQLDFRATRPAAAQKLFRNPVLKGLGFSGAATAPDELQASAPGGKCSIERKAVERQLLADPRQLLADHGRNHAIRAHCRARHQHVFVLRGHLANARRVSPPSGCARNTAKHLAPRHPAQQRTLPCPRSPHTPDPARAVRRPIALQAAPATASHRSRCPRPKPAQSRSASRPARRAWDRAWRAPPSPPPASTSPIIPFSAAQSIDLAFELQPFAHAHDRHAVVADRPRHDHRVAGLQRDAGPPGFLRAARPRPPY